MPIKPGKIVGNLLTALFVTQAMDALARFLILGRNKGGVPIVNVVRLSGVCFNPLCENCALTLGHHVIKSKPTTPTKN